MRTAQKGSFPTPPASEPQFPLPHVDDFNRWEESQEAPLFADQIGAFEVHAETGNSANKVSTHARGSPLQYLRSRLGFINRIQQWR